MRSYSEHPLGRLLDMGVLATINTDDPAICGIDLDYELNVAAPMAGLTSAQVERARANAETIAFGI